MTDGQQSAVFKAEALAGNYKANFILMLNAADEGEKQIKILGDYAAVLMKATFKDGAFTYQYLPQDLFDKVALSVFEDTLKNLLDQYNEVAISERTKLRRGLSEIDNQLESMALRRALGEISQEVYEIGNRELLKRKEGLEKELGYWLHKISNSQSIIPTIIATASDISSLWKKGSLEIKQDIQRLIFPDGIFWDKRICDYRTENENEFFDLMCKYSTTYTKTKETSSCEPVSLCAR